MNCFKLLSYATATPFVFFGLNFSLYLNTFVFYIYIQIYFNYLINYFILVTVYKKRIKIQDSRNVEDTFYINIDKYNRDGLNVDKAQSIRTQKAILDKNYNYQVAVLKGQIDLSLLPLAHKDSISEMKVSYKTLGSPTIVGSY